jgi:TonB family protein
MTILLAIGLSAMLLPESPAVQAPRDTPPPAIENARRERELRAVVAAGAATRDTFMELAALAYRQHRFDDTIAALREAAALEPDSPEPQHTIATYYWERAAKDTTLDAATRLSSVKQGIAAEDRALALKPDYLEALVYKNILLRLQATLTDDVAERQQLIARADDLRARALALQRQRNPAERQANAPEPPPPPVAGFTEPYDQTLARLQPMRVGGNLRAPTKVHDVRPVYPAEAQAARIQGVVVIEAVIDESGSVTNARVLRSVPMLDEAALSAVSRWQFAPTEMNGRPVSVVMTVTVNFALQ